MCALFCLLPSQFSRERASTDPFVLGFASLSSWTRSRSKSRSSDNVVEVGEDAWAAEEVIVVGEVQEVSSLAHR